MSVTQQDREGMQAEELGKGCGQQQKQELGGSRACLEEATAAGSFWGMELPGSGPRKATGTEYSPQNMGSRSDVLPSPWPACKALPLRKTCLLAAAEESGFSPWKTLFLGERDFFNPKPSPE